MEFRIQQNEDKASSTYFSPPTSNNNNFFTEQALRAGYFSNGIRRTDFVSNSDPVTEAKQREIEKERIREEIIAAEIIRRRVLEAEVRRELALERELGFPLVPNSFNYQHNHNPVDNSRLQERFSLSSRQEVGNFNNLALQQRPEAAKIVEIQREEGFSLISNSSCPSMWSDPRGLLSNNIQQHHLLDDSRILEEKSSPSPCPEIAEVENVSFQRHPDVANKVTEISKGPGGPVLFIAKPKNTNLTGIKRKVAAIGGTTGFALASAKKKPQKEWNCALCKVSATCEQGLNDHFKGKKHRAREAEFKANTATCEDSDNSTTSPKGSDKSELANSNSSPESNDGKEPVQSMKQLVKKIGVSAMQKKQNPEDLKKRFKFWCEYCQIGCHSATVLGDHKTGKKHLNRVQASKKFGGDGLATTTTPTTKASEVAVAEAKEEIMENTDGEVDGDEEAKEEEALEMKATIDELREGENKSI